MTTIRSCLLVPPPAGKDSVFHSVSGASLLLVTQPDHAHFAGSLLALWTADGLPAHPRRSEILFAGREHDNGWRETDAAPRCDPARHRPHDFLTLSPADRIEIWRRGVHRYSGARPYAALLIHQHAVELHRSLEHAKRFLRSTSVVQSEAQQ